MGLALKVAGFAAGEAIPKRHTGEGPDVAPALEWSGAPAQTKSFALIMDDPDAPGGTWNHWLLWDIPAAKSGIGEGVRTGVSGTNDFGRPEYGGPMPPRGHGPHRYFFRLFAVDTASLNVKPGARRRELDRALEGHVLAGAEYMGRYERK